MKFFVVIVVLFFSNVYSQSNERIDLNWKVEPGEIIVYKASTQPIDSTKFSDGFENIFKRFFDSFSPDTSNFDTLISKSNNFFKEINSIFNESEMYAVLQNDKNNDISIKLLMQDKRKNNQNNTTENSNKITDLFKNLLKGVLLRGKMKSSGEISSFYMKQDQKNLLSLFFELPTKQVAIGDSWELNISLLMFDQNFICDSSEKKNSVTLVDIYEKENDKIAVLQYNIYEYAKGVFSNPMSGKSIPTYMKMSNKGLAEFSITNGRWNNYNCISEIKAEGVLQQHIIQKNYLELLDDIPVDLKSKLQD